MIEKYKKNPKDLKTMIIRMINETEEWIQKKYKRATEWNKKNCGI
jgi:hypothetical protein